MSVFSDFERYLFHEGKSYEIYTKMGAHICSEDGVNGVHFAVWAPNARSVSVVCDALGWERELPMRRSHDGIWESFVPNIGVGTAYRYAIIGANGEKLRKSDPYAFSYELRPDNASVVYPPSGVYLGGWYSSVAAQQQKYAGAPDGSL